MGTSIRNELREILTNMIQVGIAIGAGEELDHDKEWHLERAEQQIEDFYRNKIPEEIVWVKNVLSWNRNYVNGYNQAIDDITAQFNSKGDSGEH